eukprot:2328930-Amphidinium_carterae.1
MKLVQRNSLWSRRTIAILGKDACVVQACLEDAVLGRIKAIKPAPLPEIQPECLEPQHLVAHRCVFRSAVLLLSIGMVLGRSVVRIKKHVLTPNPGRIRKG